MPKKTARRTSSRRTVSRARKESGLIAKKKMLKRSAGTKSTLDNRSHRTPQAQLQGQLRQDTKRLNRDLCGRHERQCVGTCQLQRSLCSSHVGLEALT
jgi:hypothetical protein